MAKILAYCVKTGQVGYVKETGYLNGLYTYRAPIQRLLGRPAKGRYATIQAGKKNALNQSVQAYIVPNYYADLYRRVMVIPQRVELGAIATDQVFTVQIWNGNKHAIQLSSATLSQAEGIQLSSGELPQKLQGLALSRWTVHVGMAGPAVIDSLITWHILDQPSVSLAISGSRSVDWNFFPNWEQEVTENLIFLTALHQSYSGAEQRVARRLSPRRTFEFQVVCEGTEKQFFDQMLYAYGSRVWGLPIFTDGTALLKTAPTGTLTLSLQTEGRDFSEGGQVLLLDSTGHREIVEITNVNADSIQLKRPLQQPYLSGAKVYPVRAAIFTDPPSLRRLSDGVMSVQVRFAIIEHNGFSDEIRYLPTYRGFPVLELAADWTDDLTGDYQRLLAEFDNQTGKPYRLDTAQKAFQVISQRFVLSGRTEQRKFRQLCYYLKGRQKPIWISTLSADFYAVQDIVGNTLYVQSTGYSAMLLQQSGRQDIRIELADGQVHYRRIVYAEAVNQNMEQLILAGEALLIKQEDIIKISFMTLSRLDSDTITWQHKTDADGIASVSLVFRGLRDDLEEKG